MKFAPTVFILLKCLDKDLTNFLVNFSFEDCLDEDDLVKINLKGSALKNLIGKELSASKEIQFKYGYYQGEQSQWRKAMITKIDVDYGDSLQVSIEATDYGVVMKQNSPQNVFNNKTASEIALSFAQKYNLRANIDETTLRYKQMIQGHHSDWHFLQILAKQELNYRFFISGNTLHFGKNKLKENAIVSFSYNNGQSNIINFNPKLNIADKSKQKTTVVAGINPNTQKEIKSIFDINNGANTILGSLGIDKMIENNKILPIPTDLEYANTIAQNSQSSVNELTGELNLSKGFPFLKPEDIISLNNLSTLHDGNWYIQKVRHSIDSKGYFTTLELNKNALKRKTLTAEVTSSQNSNTNQSVGPNKPNNEVKLVRIDVNNGVKILK